MRIHVVKEGETINQIAALYRVSPLSILQNNMLEVNCTLVIGQSIVILFPEQIHIVREDDTLESIAVQYDISVIKLLQNNSWLSKNTILIPGLEIIISYKEEKLGDIAINGYVYPFIDKEVLMRTLPYLTFVTLVSYGITHEGELIPIDDTEIIQLAREYNVAPIMQISTITSNGDFSCTLSRCILNDMTAQNRLIDNILVNLKEKNYYGVEIDFEYILPEDRIPFVEFITYITVILNEEGYQVMVDLSPKSSSVDRGMLYESHDYYQIGQVSNQVYLLTYEWGFIYSPPMAIAPLDKVKTVLDYAVTLIASEKLFLGIPNFEYDFTYPYECGISKAKTLKYLDVIDLAREKGVVIEYDDVSQSPYFIYIDKDGLKHEVWFEDARSVDAKYRLVPKYGLKGVSYWTIMNYFSEGMLIANSLFNIKKII